MDFVDALIKLAEQNIVAFIILVALLIVRYQDRHEERQSDDQKREDTKEQALIDLFRQFVTDFSTSFRDFVDTQKSLRTALEQVGTRLEKHDEASTADRADLDALAENIRANVKTNENKLDALPVTLAEAIQPQLDALPGALTLAVTPQLEAIASALESLKQEVNNGLDQLGDKLPNSLRSILQIETKQYTDQITRRLDRLTELIEAVQQVQRECLDAAEKNQPGETGESKAPEPGGSTQSIKVEEKKEA